MSTKPSPGSDEARELGCQCPQMDNAYGKGYLSLGSVFVYSGRCDLHREESGLETPVYSPVEEFRAKGILVAKNFKSKY